MLTFDGLLQGGFRLRVRPLAIISVDNSAEGNDRTGLVITHRIELELGERYDPDFATETTFIVRHAEYLERGTLEPDKITILHAWHRKLLELTPRKIAGHKFVIERNGVGTGLYQHLQAKIDPGYVLPIMTVGGGDDRPWKPDVGYRMPRDPGLDWLRFQVSLERVRVDGKSKGIRDLGAEMRAFVYNGRRPEAMEGAYDDLVMALATGVWAGSKIIPPLVKAEEVRLPKKVH